MEGNSTGGGQRFWARYIRRRDLMGGLLATGVLGAMFAHAPHAIASGGWFASHRHGRRWGRWHRHGFDSLESAQRHARGLVSHAFDMVDANASQRTEAAAIADRVVGDVFPMLQEHHKAHASIKSLLSAESIDRQALEVFRQQQADQWSTVSAKVSDGLADLAELLTPEQRRVLLDHWETGA